MGAKVCKYFLVIALAVPVCGDVGAVTLTVDDNGTADYSSIQDAIDDSSDGDVIEVAEGSYTSFNFYGRRIKVVGPREAQVNTTDAAIPAVQFDSGEDQDSVLEGLTIHGHIDSSDHSGKTIECYYSSPVIRDVHVVSGSGTGIYAKSSSPTIINCKITGVWTGGERGIYGCNGTISGCEISLCEYGIERCDGVVLNCRVFKNLYGVLDCRGAIKNCTVAENTGDGLKGCIADVSNCIVAFNGRHGLSDCGSGLSYNNVYGNAWGSYSDGTVPSPTDIHVDPLYVGGPQYTLKSTIGRGHYLYPDYWTTDDVNSPCIDAGDPCDSVGYEPNPNGGRINMGAYGGTAFASKSPNGTGPEPTPRCETPIPGDSDGDCRVDLRDIATVAAHWLECNLIPATACQ